MNERIRELAEQAGFFPALTWDHSDWHAAGHSSLFEKFAELIVKECIRLCDQVDFVGADDCIENIKEHFEIKK